MQICLQVQRIVRPGPQAAAGEAAGCCHSLKRLRQPGHQRMSRSGAAWVSRHRGAARRPRPVPQGRRLQPWQPRRVTGVSGSSSHGCRSRRETSSPSLVTAQAKSQQMLVIPAFRRGNGRPLLARASQALLAGGNQLQSQQPQPLDQAGTPPSWEGPAGMCTPSSTPPCRTHLQLQPSGPTHLQLQPLGRRCRWMQRRRTSCMRSCLQLRQGSWC